MRPAEIRFVHSADMQFVGQTHILNVPLPSTAISRGELQRLFEAAYFARFKVSLPEIRANLVNLNSSVIGVRDALDLSTLIDPAGRASSLDGALSERRQVWFDGGWRETPVYHAKSCRSTRSSTVRPSWNSSMRPPSSSPAIGDVGRRRQSDHRDRGQAMTIALDAITLSVIQAALQQACDEMDLTFSRAAFSPVIAEANDRSDGIYSAEDGSLIAQGAGGLPVFVGVMQYSTKTLIEMIRDGRCLPPEPGDIYIVNDPYLGGTHLMDVRFAMPVYRSGKIFCWLSNTGHWPDIGGSVPGGFSASATAVEQEGLRLPPVKLFKKGVLDPEIHAIIASNIRIADQRIGDIKAQAAALMVGQDRLGAILDRYGDDTVVAAIAELRRRAALQMRAHIAEIADGVYRSQGVRRLRRGGQRAADHRARRREARRHADLRLRGLQPALRRADEQRARHHAVVGLPGDAPHFS